MSLKLPEKKKISKQALTIYLISAIACIFAIAVVVGIQVLGNDIIDNILGVSKITKKTEQEELSLKANFEELFNNTLEEKSNYSVRKIDSTKPIVYSSYISNEYSNNNYELDVCIPYINIANNTVQEYNNTISKIFEDKAKEVLSSEDKNVVYTVKYEAYIENNILSLIIYSNLKQAYSPQRVIIQTFNFNLENNKVASLSDILKIYDLDKDYVQNKITNEIKIEEQKSQDLKQLGYNVFTRNLDSDIYKLANITEFFVHNNNLYLIFAYGNEDFTSQLDLVVI